MCWGPCRPTPWEVASTLDHWEGNESQLDPIMQTKEIRIIPGPETVGGIHRAELTPRIAMLNRRAFGVVVEINESGRMVRGRLNAFIIGPPKDFWVLTLEWAVAGCSIRPPDIGSP